MPNSKLFNSNSSVLKSLQDQIDAITGAPVVSSLPIGAVIPFGGRNTAVPSGFLLCNGTLLTRADFLELFNVIGTDWGTTSGINFRIPTTSGLHLRGVAYGSGNDPDRNSRTAYHSGGASGDQVGSYQADQNGSHNHGGPNHNHSGASHRHLGGVRTVYNDIAVSGNNAGLGTFAATHIPASSGAYTFSYFYGQYTDYQGGATGYASGTTGSQGGNQTNVNNVNMNYIIKYE
jgi:microcystin-dependent protein